MIKRLLISLLLSSALLAVYSCDEKNASHLDDVYDPLNKGEKVEGTIDPNDKTEYYPKAEGSLRIMAYNVGAFSKFMDNSTTTIAAMIKEIEADVVGLNELDSCNTRHKVNQVAELAQALGGWKWYFGRAMDYKSGAYGNGVVVPKSTNIVDKYFVTLPKGSGSEQRSIAVIETETYVLGAAHLDHTDTDACLGQVSVVNSWVEKKYKNSDKPVFFVGDMNSVPDSEPIAALKTQWNILSSMEHTIPVNNPNKCIDYVFHYKKSKAVTVTGTHTLTKVRTGDPKLTSDHLPVYADVKF